VAALVVVAGLIGLGVWVRGATRAPSHEVAALGSNSSTQSSTSGVTTTQPTATVSTTSPTASSTPASTSATTHRPASTTANASPTHAPPPPPPPSPPPSPPSGSSFDDELNGSGVNTAAWTVLNRPGDQSNSEAQCYRSGNVGESGGSLTETVVSSGACSGYSYTSGAVQMRSYNFRYGTVTVRAKLAGGQGPWPAIWLLGADCQASNVTDPGNVGTCNWPQPGSDEIDIAEVLGSNHGNVNEQVHSGGNNSGCSASADATAWHVYTLVWRAGSLTWQVDGRTTCTLTSGVPSHPMFLILNLALGGVGGGSISNGTLPQTSAFDYVRVAA
jgi:beta-glucanase (GH16 family)